MASLGLAPLVVKVKALLDSKNAEIADLKQKLEDAGKPDPSDVQAAVDLTALVSA